MQIKKGRRRKAHSLAETMVQASNYEIFINGSMTDQASQSPESLALASELRAEGRVDYLMTGVNDWLVKRNPAVNHLYVIDSRILPKTVAHPTMSDLSFQTQLTWDRVAEEVIKLDLPARVETHYREEIIRDGDMHPSPVWTVRLVLVLL
jgi:hypothetical protein